MKSIVVALSLLVAPAAMAQTFVVDAASGPGTNYVSIAVAVAAVPDGSTLLIRPGEYQPFVIDAKGLTLLGEPGVRVLPGLLDVRMQNTAPSQTITIRDMEVESGRILCSDCAGLILLDDLQSLIAFSFSLRVTNCDRVNVRQCTFRAIAFGSSSAPVQATNSRLTLDNCEAWGTGVGNLALRLVGSDLQAVTSGFFLFATGGNSSSIVADNNSTMRLLGDSVVWANQGPPILGGVVRLGPDVVFNGIPTPIQAVSVTQVPDEFVEVIGGQSGGSVSSAMVGDSASLGLLLIGAPGPAFAVAGVADVWWLDPLISEGLTFGLMNNPISATVALPAAPALQGATYGFQGVYFHPTNSLSASVPAMFVIH